MLLFISNMFDQQLKRYISFLHIFNSAKHFLKLVLVFSSSYVYFKKSNLSNGMYEKQTKR